VVKPGQPILRAAQDAGLDPPYACEEGICCTCRAKLSSGQVHMAVREALSDWEIEKGYILTCQAVPLTPEVELEYG
jgi:ferredoxin